MSEYKLSIVIPIYNALDDVKILLKSLNTNLDFNICEVFLLNDCSGQDTTEFLESFIKEYSHYKYIKNEENLGFVKTCNKGMELSLGDIIVLLNSDTKIPNGFCDKVIKCFEYDSNIGIASPISSSSYLYYIPMRENINVEQMNKLLTKNHKYIYPLIPSAEGFCYCIRKEVIENQGYLDTTWGKGYYEEVDYSYRAITNGWKNVLIDDLYVYHKGEASFGKKQRDEFVKQNIIKFKERWEHFCADYVRENDLINPVENIERKMFPNEKIQERRSCNKSFIENVFSVKNSNDRYYKVLTIFGKSIKWKRGWYKKWTLKRIYKYM